MQQSGLDALMNLAVGANNVRLIREAGGIPVVLDAMRTGQHFTRSSKDVIQNKGFDNI